MSQVKSSQTKENGLCKATESKCFYNGIKILGDAWTLFVITSLANGEKRFCEIQRDLNNINPVTLTSRLKKLEKLKFIERREETIDKLSVTYKLTKKGIALLPVIEAIKNYANDHIN